MGPNLRKLASRIAFNSRSKSEVIASLYPSIGWLPLSIRRV